MKEIDRKKRKLENKTKQERLKHSRQKNHAHIY